jgi:hypothetical protein
MQFIAPDFGLLFFLSALIQYVPLAVSARRFATDATGRGTVPAWEQNTLKITMLRENTPTSSRSLRAVLACSY